MGDQSTRQTEDGKLSATLDGPSRTIVVEPVREPAVAPAPVEPEPAPEPAQPRQPAG